MSTASPRPATLVPMHTVAEVATYLQVSEMTVYRLITGGDLPAAKIGRNLRVHPEDLARYVDGSRVARAS